MPIRAAEDTCVEVDFDYDDRLFAFVATFETSDPRGDLSAAAFVEKAWVWPPWELLADALAAQGVSPMEAVWKSFRWTQDWERTDT